MHEANFTQEIVNSILDELKKYPSCRAKQIKVKVGEMLHLMPESVKTHYAQMTQGTNLEGVMLILEEMPVEIKCRSCGSVGGVEDHHVLFCSKCDSFNVELIKGKEVVVDSIEMMEEKGVEK